MIRRLAGTHVATQDVAKAKRDEWSNALAGKEGFRGCGPASWDNAIRALEEDR